VADRAVLPRGIHPLKDQQQGIAIGRVEKVLKRAQLLNVIL